MSSSIKNTPSPIIDWESELFLQLAGIDTGADLVEYLNEGGTIEALPAGAQIPALVSLFYNEGSQSRFTATTARAILPAILAGLAPDVRPVHRAVALNLSGYLLEEIGAEFLDCVGEEYLIRRLVEGLDSGAPHAVRHAAAMTSSQIIHVRQERKGCDFDTALATGPDAVAAALARQIGAWREPRPEPESVARSFPPPAPPPPPVEHARHEITLTTLQEFSGLPLTHPEIRERSCIATALLLAITGDSEESAAFVTWCGKGGMFSSLPRELHADAIAFMTISRFNTLDVDVPLATVKRIGVDIAAMLDGADARTEAMALSFLVNARNAIVEAVDSPAFRALLDGAKNRDVQTRDMAREVKRYMRKAA